ncbi:hypothetical protein KUTeg_013286 [Tegillarca granosa]|uniref:Uncharacterized protein n=1 Tax=Tegillarca granosa TaxID=220873 RepID=A0ABQ9EXR2_TEGGR|nr:hypothetical protein KUTeg_013286 [Tegillarca granosa]
MALKAAVKAFQLEVYLTQSGTWTDVTPMSVRRYECGAVAHRNKLYVLGGMVTETRENASFHYHDNQAEYWTLKTNTWHTRIHFFINWMESKKVAKGHIMLSSVTQLAYPVKTWLKPMAHNFQL